MRAKKFEAVRIQFFCDVFAAVAASLGNIRNYHGNGKGDNKVIKQKVKAPSARMRFVFFCGLAYGPHVSSEDGHRKRMFLNALQCGDF